MDTDNLLAFSKAQTRAQKAAAKIVQHHEKLSKETGGSWIVDYDGMVKILTQEFVDDK